MADSTKNAKFFNTLTEFALVLLIPPKPLANKTISVNEYVDKLLSVENSQNLLFCSIMASNDENAIANILKLGKIEWVHEKLKQEGSDKEKSSDIFLYAQILFNCSKQKAFRDKFRSHLPLDLYNILKDQTPEAPKLLRD